MTEVRELRDLLATAPTPLSQLLRRVLNARPGAEHHAAAFYVLEASLKLASSARICLLLDRKDLLDEPLATKLEALVLPSLGHWCSFLAEANRTLGAKGVSAGPFSEVARDMGRTLASGSALAAFIDAARDASILADDRARTAKKAGVIGFFEALVSYRNQVLGHGALRSSAFYDRFATLFRAVIVELLGGRTLLGGGELALARPDTDGEGVETLRWKTLVGLAGITLDTEAPSAERLSLYLRQEGRAISLHPLVVCVEDEHGHERFGFLNRTVEAKTGGVRRADYLDYATGEELVGIDARKALTELLGKLRGEKATTEEVLELEATLLADPSDSAEAPAVPKASASMLGKKLGGKYTIDTLIGEGGMASVFEGRHVDLGTRRVAIKILHADLARRADIAERFRAEARRMSELDHPGIVDVTDFGQDEDGTVFFVMERLTGLPLDRWRENADPSIERIVSVIADVLEALSFAHERDLVHRDLKPQNLFLARDARGGEHAKILDFGIAKALTEDGSSTADGMLLGTPYYMSPEQIVDPAAVDARADVYSMGASLFQLLTGVPPVDGGSALGIVSKVRAGEVLRHPKAHRSDVPEWLDAIVAKAMALSRADRFETASAMRDALVRGAAGDAHTVVGDRAPAAVAVTEPGGPIVTAPIERSLAAVAATSPGTEERAAPSRKGPVARLVPALSVVGLLALVGTLVTDRMRPGPATPAASATVASGSAAIALREPTLGLRALGDFHDPKPAGLALLNSPSFWESALKDFEDAEKQESAPARWLAATQFCAGELSIQRGDLAAAEASLREAARIDPTWAAPLAGLGSALSRAGRFDEAIAAIQAAQRLEPTWIGAARTEAIIHAQAGRLPEAVQAYRRALALGPGNAITLGHLALAYHAMELDSEAKRHGVLALEADPDQTAVRLMMAEVALEQKDAEEALEQATRAAAIDPSQPAILLARADALALLGRKDEALESYRRARDAYVASGNAAPLSGRLLLASELADRGELPPPRGEQAARTPHPSPPKPPSRHERTACPPGDPLCGM